MTDNATSTATATESPDTPAARLAAECGGCVFLPGSPGYAAGRVPWNVAIDQRPAAVARPTTAEQVAELVRAAARHGLRVAPQGSGHGAGPLARVDLSDVVLLRTDGWRSVTVDPERRVARVAPGTVWQEVVEAAAPHGLTPLHGSSPDVGVAGYTLGGGVSFYARKHGLACNVLVAAEVVTAEGEIVRADATTHPDLFWALRGGGGNFGIVTALEFELFEIPDVVAGMLLWDLSHAEPVLRRWVEWCATAPEEATTTLRFVRFPPLPFLPEFLRGRHVVVVDGALLCDDARAAELLAPLRELGPEMDTFDRIPAPALLAVHMDPPEPTPAVGGTTMLTTLDDAAMAMLLEQYGPGATTSVLIAELRQLGGALARHEEGSGVLACLDGEFVAYFAAIAATPEMAAAGLADIDRGIAALAPWTVTGRYQNFAETPTDPRVFYAVDDWERIQRVRRACDPTGLFVANHPIVLD